MTYSLCRACKRTALVLLLPLFLATAGARATSFFYQFTNVFAGTRPEGSPAWVSALFSDVTPGTVQLKISADALTGGEFLSAMFFNLDPSLKPTKLIFSYVSGSGGFTLPTIKEGANRFNADGQGKYDIDFTFSQNAAHEFTGNDYVVYDITSSAFTLTASDFDVLSTAAGGCSGLLAAAEISDIPGKCNSTGAGWVAPAGLSPVPEPHAFALLALGGGFCAAGCWRRIFTGRI
jgi:hypothetical protein